MTFFKVHIHLPFQTNNRYEDYIDNENYTQHSNKSIYMNKIQLNSHYRLK